MILFLIGLGLILMGIGIVGLGIYVGYCLFILCDDLEKL